tara:strand:+ start:118 stop:492 length:375 start_codon:yes stop_codon:yes gene_type:complete
MAIGALNQHIVKTQTEVALKQKTKVAKDQAAAKFAMFKKEQDVKQQNRIKAELVKGAFEIVSNADILDNDPIKIKAVNFLKTVEGLPDFVKQSVDDETIDVNPQSPVQQGTLEKGRIPTIPTAQ